MELRDLKIGDFVRTKKGIAKIIDRILDPTHYYFKMWVTDIYLELNDDTEYICEKDIIKASDKLIDLVEVKDIVLIEEFVDEACIIFEDMYYIQNENQLSNFKDSLIRNKNKKIKQILTKEMFDQISYKVGE